MKAVDALGRLHRSVIASASNHGPFRAARIEPSFRRSVDIDAAHMLQTNQEKARSHSNLLAPQ
ncbi:hypothetical protein ACD578_27240 (plasmid) [Microvirga sp. RSM25]|uniref:hypothetical protein n=1 Tax=Microvirga sp. RSM25 TaxID=3273802 RepID=UPI00384DD67D